MTPLNDVLRSGSRKVLAVDDCGRALTSTDVESEAERWRRLLGPEKAFAILLAENSIPSLKAYLGLIAANHAVLPVRADISTESLADLCARYSPAAVLAGADDIDIVKRYRSDIALHPDLSVLLSTSGSTGSPKLTRFSWAQMEANARAIISYLAIDESERAFAHL